MRILIISQWFNPEPFFKGLPFAQELVRLGHEVEVLTGFPNYPGGELYEGYKIKPFQREIIDGISILRVPLYPSHDSNSLKRIVNYVSFAMSSAVIGPFLTKQPDIVYVYHPPVTTGLTALVFHWIKKVPFVYDIQDLWPDTLGTTGMLDSQAAFWMIHKWCHLIYAQAAKIVVLSPGFKRVLMSRGVPSSKIEVIYNWSNEISHLDYYHDDELKKSLGFSGRFNILFAGTMGKAQSLDTILDAAKLIIDRIPKVQFVFIGGGIEVDRLKKRTRDLELSNVIFLPRRPLDEINQILKLADVLMVHLKDDPLFEITIPSKTQAYLAAGKPILMAMKGDSADLIKKADAGLVCNPQDSDSIAASIEKFIQLPKEQMLKMGRNGMRFYKNELNLKVGVKKFIEVFRSVIKNQNS